ncbi:MAG: putative glycoside hydrolase [Gemmatimonadales bacterium]
MRRLILFLLLLATVPAALRAQDRRWGDELPRPFSTERLIPVAPRQLEPADWPAPPLAAPPDTVRAIYLNAWVFGSSRFYDLVRMADTTEINAFVIDVKDDTGFLTYESSVPTARAIGANREIRARDFKSRLAVLHAHRIYPIARIVVAKDPLLARERPGWSIQDRNGGLWRDRKGTAWVDAYTDSVWIYAAELGREAVREGFSELQFDYVRFPDEPRSRLASAVYPGQRKGESTRDGIVRNLQLLGDRVRSSGVPFTIDVFGMTSSATADLGIGQIWEDLVSVADVVLPMVYPSHYYGGFGEIRHPNSEPYRVVRQAVADGIQRSRALPASARIRPWLQAFTLGPPRYTPFHVREQIRAVEELGIASWVLWNPRGVYDPGYFKPTAHTSSLASRAARTGQVSDTAR